MKYVYWIIIFCWISIGVQHSSGAQDSLSYEEQLAIIENELDSFSIFLIIDSLIALEDVKIPSEFNLRIGYTSEVLSAGRDFGINQQGVSTGISYYHKSGFFSDVSGFWNSETDPNYSLTILSAGYLGSIKKRISYTFSYEHWLQPETEIESTLSNSIGTSLSYDFGPVYSGIDYSFLFGSESANRIIWNLSGSIKFKDWWIFKTVSINPTFSLLLGDQNVTVRIPNETPFRTRLRESGLTDNQIMDLNEQATQINRRFQNGLLTEQQRNNLFLLLLSSVLSEDQLNALLEEDFQEQTSFGVMNYSLSLPVILSMKRLSLLFSYTYNFPVEIPGETLDLTPTGFFAISLNWRLPTK